MMRLFIPVVASGLIACSDTAQTPRETNEASAIGTAANLNTAADSLLRHIVLFRFKEGTSRAALAEIEATFAALPEQIPEIAAYEWGLNNSPEGLDQGYTHAFLLTFASEDDRAAYLPHPAHVAFTEVVGPHVDAVHVVDYWTRGAD